MLIASPWGDVMMRLKSVFHLALLPLSLALSATAELSQSGLEAAPAAVELKGGAPAPDSLRLERVWKDGTCTSTLSNTSDEILLLAPDESELDRVAWVGDTGLKISAGKSLERPDFAQPTRWQAASARWPGSAGDFGSPKAAATATLASPTPAASATITGTVALPTVTPTSGPAPTP